MKAVKQQGRNPARELCDSSDPARHAQPRGDCLEEEEMFPWQPFLLRGQWSLSPEATGTPVLFLPLGREGRHLLGKVRGSSL